MAKYKLKKADGYQLETDGNILVIKWSLGGKVFERKLVDGALQPESTIKLCDEQVSLFDGASLERFSTQLTINKEEL